MKNRQFILAPIFVILLLACVYWFCSSAPEPDLVTDRESPPIQTVSTAKQKSLSPPTKVSSPPPATAGGPGTIRGIVYTHTAEPAAGVVVQFTLYDDWGNPKQDGKAAQSIETDESGVFEAVGLALGEWHLNSRTERGAASDRARITAQAPVAEVVLMLRPGELTSGVVVNDSGIPVPRAILTPLAHDGADLASYDAAAYATETDVSGRFAIPVLPPHAWDFLVRAEGFADTVSQPVKAGTNENRIVIRRGERLPVLVLEAESGRPMEGIAVVAVDATVPDAISRGVSNEDGELSFELNPGVRYRFYTDTKPYVPADGVVEFDFTNPTQTPLELYVTEGGGIEGRVVYDDGSHASGIHVIAALEGISDLKTLHTISDADGFFAFYGLLAGAYKVNVRSRPGTVQKFADASEEYVSVLPPQTTETVNLVIPGRPMLAGVVVDEAGNPVAGVDVNVKSDSWQGVVVTGEDGRFVFEGMERGESAVVFASSASRTSGVTPQVVVGTPEARDMRVVLAYSSNGVIAGRVLDIQGRPLPAQVIAVRDDAHLLEATRGMTNASADGAFMLTGLLVGSYRLHVRPANGEQLESGRATLTEGQVLRNLILTYPVDTSLTIEGHVTDETGMPLRASLRVTRFEVQGSMPRGFARTRYDGSFRLAGLSQGEYVFVVRAEGYQEIQTDPIEAGATGVVLQLPRNPLITGTVVDQAGKPIADYTLVINLTNSGLMLSPMGNDREFHVRNAGGRFDIIVDPGRYTIEVTAEGYQPSLVDAGFHDAGSQSEEIFITVQR